MRETGRFRTVEDCPLDRRREERDLDRPHDEVVFNAELARDVLNGLDLATVDHAEVGVSTRQSAEKRVLCEGFRRVDNWRGRGGNAVTRATWPDSAHTADGADHERDAHEERTVGLDFADGRECVDERPKFGGVEDEVEGRFVHGRPRHEGADEVVAFAEVQLLPEYTGGAESAEDARGGDAGAPRDGCGEFEGLAQDGLDDLLHLPLHERGGDALHAARVRGELGGL